MKIQDILREKGRVAHTVSASERMKNVLGRFSESKIRCLAVTEGAALVGLLTLRDVVAHLDRHGCAGFDASVGEAMMRDVVTVSPEASVDEVEKTFAERRFHHLPVVEDGVLVGLVTPADVLGRHVEEMRHASALMHEYCSGVYY